MKTHPDVYTYFSIIKFFGFSYPVEGTDRAKLDELIEKEYGLILVKKSAMTKRQRDIICKIVEAV